MFTTTKATFGAFTLTLGLLASEAIGLLTGTANGQILVGCEQEGSSFMVAKYNFDGTPVNTHLIWPLGDQIFGLALDNNGHLFVAKGSSIGEYNLDGTPVNASLMSGLKTAMGIAIDGNGHLFVANYDSNTIGEYNLDGTPVNASLISGLHSPCYIVLDGNGHLFVANYGSGTIGKYNLDGTPMNASLISGLGGTGGIALDGNGHLFVGHGATVGEYNLDGTTVNPMLISSLGNGGGVYAIALDVNGHLFVANSGWYWDTGSIGEYNLDGTPVNASLISGLTQPLGLAVLPGPSSLAIIAQPQSVTVHAHNTASFTVTASGTLPLSYQWSLNGTNISGATANSLTFSNVAQADLGTYAVVVTNGFGSVTSSNAILSMYPYLAVPFSGAVTYWGKDATFNVQAWGTGPLSYQWFKDGFAIADATNVALSVTSIQFTNAGLYWVVVSSSLGSVTNPPAQVVVNPAGISFGLCPAVTIDGVVGYNYIIRRTADLGNTNAWVTMTNLTLTQPVQLWVDTNVDASLPANPHHFYQVLPGQ
jgi:hypothetical protein